MLTWETWLLAAGCGALVWGLLALLLARGKRKGRVAAHSLAAIAALGVAGAVLALPTEPHRGGWPTDSPGMGNLPSQAVENMRAMSEMMREGAKERFVGKDAPDFELPDPATGKRVRLSTLGNDRPVVLVFGSWGCNIFCGQYEHVRRLHAEFGDHAEFVFVQVADAPHAPPPQVLHALSTSGLTEETAENRQARAARAAEAMGLPFRHVLDNDDGEACRKYKAWPQRLVVVHGGKVAHDAGLGRGGMPSPWDLERVYGCLLSLAAE